jgi:hypothetical protein
MQHNIRILYFLILKYKIGIISNNINERTHLADMSYNIRMSAGLPAFLPEVDCDLPHSPQACHVSVLPYSNIRGHLPILLSSYYITFTIQVA